jgi:hypothetical protein
MLPLGNGEKIALPTAVSLVQVLEQGINMEIDKMTNTEDKMYFIAKHFKWLNQNGKVKAIRGNERGYAKVKEVVRGCSLFVHHMNDGRLIINLLVSSAAKSGYEIPCNKAVEVFKGYFKSEVQTTKWENSMGDGRIYDRYIVDVTKKDLSEIIRIVEDVKLDLPMHEG